MSGIGFEIRKILERDSYWSVIRAYGYAGHGQRGPMGTFHPEHQ